MKHQSNNHPNVSGTSNDSFRYFVIFLVYEKNTTLFVGDIKIYLLIVIFK